MLLVMFPTAIPHGVTVMVVSRMKTPVHGWVISEGWVGW